MAERLARLERAGVITGYRAVVDPAGARLRAERRDPRPARPGQLANVAEAATATPEIVDCRRVTGEDCYVATAHVRDVEHLERVIDRFAPLGQTTTSIVQSAPVAGRAVAVAIDLDD